MVVTLDKHIFHCLSIEMVKHTHPCDDTTYDEYLSECIPIVITVITHFPHWVRYRILKICITSRYIKNWNKQHCSIGTFVCGLQMWKDSWWRHQKWQAEDYGQVCQPVLFFFINGWIFQNIKMMLILMKCLHCLSMHLYYVWILVVVIINVPVVMP